MDRFRSNNFTYNKSGHKRPGGLIAPYIHITPKYEYPSDKDTENRRRVIERIKEQVDSGKTVDEAVLDVYSDEEIRKQFKYLESIKDVDLKSIFKTWYESSMKKSSFPDKYYRANSNKGDWSR